MVPLALPVSHSSRFQTFHTVLSQLRTALGRYIRVYSRGLYSDIRNTSHSCCLIEGWLLDQCGIHF